MKLRLILSIFIVYLFGFTTFALAEDPDSDFQPVGFTNPEDVKDKNKVLYGVNSKDLAKVLALTPLKHDETKDEWGDPQYLIEIGNREVILWTYGCDKGKCDDIRLSTFWKIGGNGPNLQKINQWNNEQRWTKAYMDTDNDAVLEFDMDVRDGVTYDSLLNFFEIYSSHVYKFSEYMGY